MSDDMDPEVLADLQLREQTARERPRMSDAQFGAALREAAAPRVIGKVPCRSRCGNVADWTEEAEQAFQTWNRALAAKAEAPLDKTRIAFCDSCRTRGMAMAAESNRNHVEAMRKAIAELKEHPPGTPLEERDAVKRLEKLRHPFPEDCVKAILESGSKKRGGRRRAEDY